ncbi:MAG: DUF3575 domain-containing protein [Saprospiraceae bacterium]|nr:DUF3575 domain-containing protein [Lewinella sp.]
MKAFFFMTKTTAMILVLTLLLSTKSFGQSSAGHSDSTAVSGMTAFKQAINFCPIAIAFGIYSVNYERLTNDHHGFMIRGDYESIPNRFSDANINVSGKAAIVNYRYHVKGGLNSLFIGAFSRYRVYTGDGNLKDTSFDFTLSEITIGANAGKRWILKNGLNLNLVLGYGLFMDKMDSSSSDSDIINSIHTFQKEYDLYNGLYGEVSIGYAF